MSNQVRGKFFTVLLVEDDDDDVVLYQREMKRNGFVNPLQRVKNGDAAIAYLRGKGAYADWTKFGVPSLILTDLRMPKITGLEMLQWIKNHPKYKVVPTIMISSSTDLGDIRNADTAGADAYMIKQGPPDQLVRRLALRVAHEDFGKRILKLVSVVRFASRAVTTRDHFLRRFHLSPKLKRKMTSASQ